MRSIATEPKKAEGNEMYPTAPAPYGGLQRYVVLLRVTTDLATSPSGDELTTHTVWADNPYQASSVAHILSERQRGVKVRRLVGLEEWPLHAEAQS